MQQRDLTPEALAGILRGLSRQQLLAMASRARALGKPDATRAVAEACMELARVKHKVKHIHLGSHAA